MVTTMKGSETWGCWHDYIILILVQAAFSAQWATRVLTEHKDMNKQDKLRDEVQI